MSFDGMICTCHAAGIRAVEALRIDAMRRLGLARPKDLTLAVVMSLAFDFEADVVVDSDMWFGIWLTTPLQLRQSDDPHWHPAQHGACLLAHSTLEIQCDHPADGLVYLWAELAAQFPERVTTSSDGTDADVLAATRASDALCEDCQDDADSVNETRDACAALWGAHVLDVTIDELFRGRHTGPSLVGRGLFTGEPNGGSP